jgi:hypothetical protein
MSHEPVIALVEPFWIGHPETQLRLFTEALLRQEGRRILVLCQYPEAILSWVRIHHPGKVDRCFAAPFSFCDNRGTYPGANLASWARAHQSLIEAERSYGFTVDKVFITWLDPFIGNDPTTTAALMPRPWVGLYLFPSHLRKLTPLSRLIRPVRLVEDKTFMKNPHCHGVAVLDEGVTKPLKSIVPGARVHTLPDVADMTLPETLSPLTGTLQQKAAGRPIIGLLGVLGRRKGTLSFLRAIDKLNPDQYFFLLAGRLGSIERNTYGRDKDELESLLAIAKKRENVLLHLEHIETEAAFNSLTLACSVLYMAYEQHDHSSGILSKAAYFKKLVIAPDRGCVAERVRKFRLGVTIPAGSVMHAASAMRELCHGPSLADHLTAARFGDYHAIHNSDRLETSLNQLLAEIP